MKEEKPRKNSWKKPTEKIIKEIDDMCAREQKLPRKKGRKDAQIYKLQQKQAEEAEDFTQNHKPPGSPNNEDIDSP